jgi:type I restriction enzyme S subunit
MNNDGNKIFMENANNWISDPTRKQLGATAFPAGSIVFAKVGAAIFLERKKILSRPSCIDNNMAAFVIDENQADISFIHLQLLNVKFGALVATTALPALNGKVLSEMLLTLPPTKEEQTAIAEVLTDIDTQLTALETQRTKTAQLKQGMMQALLTGRIRLI